MYGIKRANKSEAVGKLLKAVRNGYYGRCFATGLKKFWIMQRQMKLIINTTFCRILSQKFTSCIHLSESHV